MTIQLRPIKVWWVGALCGLGLLIQAADVDAGSSVYLALGDSITFGVGSNDLATDISNGDRGYVGLYANYLAGQQGGVRPTVLNLAVSGETSSSFFGTGVGLDGPGASMRNTNYTGATLPSQDALMLSTIKSQLAAGNSISNVTISLGANDLFYALATGGSFPDALAAFQKNELTLLGQIHSLLPTTSLILLGYYDPYAPFANDPTSPFYPTAQATAQAVPLINSLIAADAQGVGAGYANLFPVFQGLELADTYIATGNVHPTLPGYQLIATSVESVPEPASVLMLAGGLSLVAAGVHRRRRVAA